MALKEYHRVWLDAHPERSECWLLELLRDGFDVHHLDGDPLNNDPLNLVLIEARDHLMLHSGVRVPPSAVVRRLRPIRGPKPRTMERGRIAYRYALEAETTGERGVWRNANQVVSQELGEPCVSAQSSAMAYAKAQGLRWPLKLAAGRR